MCDPKYDFLILGGRSVKKAGRMNGSKRPANTYNRFQPNNIFCKSPLFRQSKDTWG